MRVSVQDGNKRLHLEERDIPALHEDEALVEVALTSICGTDNDCYSSSADWAKGRVGGHEFTGTVSQVGSGMKGFAAGDRVVAAWGVGCGECEHCQAGRMNLCDKMVVFDGAHADYIAVPRADISLAHLPENISWKTAIVMACSLSTGYCGVEISGVRPNETLAILGLGAVGLCMVLSAKSVDASRIVGVDAVDYRRSKALELGACEVGSPLDTEWVSSHHGTADVVLVATANPVAMETAVYLARKAGRIIVIGSQLNATVPFERVAGFGLHIHATWSMLGGDYMRRIVDLVSIGKIDARKLDSLVTHEVPLAQIQRAFDLFSNYDEQAIKIAIRP